MSENEIKAQLKELIVERLFLNVKAEEIQDDENLMGTYNIDSVQLFEIVVGLEEVFGVSMAEADFSIELFENVNSIADYVKSNLAEA
jgi:acyl carrier protein